MKSIPNIENHGETNPMDGGPLMAQQAPMMPGQELPQQPMRPLGGWRARWGRQLMAGTTAVGQTLPMWFAGFAFGTYLVALLGVNMLYSGYGTEWYFWLFGIAWVAGFFFLSVHFSRVWNIKHIRRSKDFAKKLFWIGFLIRAAYAIFIYFFYIEMTGKPYEFEAADSIGYVETAASLASCWENGNLWNALVDLAHTSFADMGYPLFILIPIRVFGVDASLVILRIINAIFGAWTSVIVYRLLRRSMGETTARFAAIFCMLHPVLICYVGMTLKEIFMTWLVMLFVDVADKMLRRRKYSFVAVAPVVLLGGSLFMFRTVLGMVAFMAVFFALVMIDSKIVSVGRKIVLGTVLVGAVLLGVSDNIMREVRVVAETDVVKVQQNTMVKRYGSEKGSKTGNKLANYVGAAVFAPLIFTIPFPTMVEAIAGQEAMRLIHGGNWVRNIMSGFVILAMFILLLSGDWRRYTLPLAFLIGYMIVLVFSAFAHSLRFHIPVMPIEMMFAAYAITSLRKRHKRWYLYWCLFMVVACFAWNWFKLAGRGLV